MDLDPTFLEFLRTLSSRRVRYLVVGGYALAAHGWPRFTEDFDVWVEPTKANAHRVALALADFGFPAYAAHEAEFATLDRMTHLGVPPLRIDIMTSITGVPSFRQAWASRRAVVLGSLADLVLLGSLDAPTSKRPARSKRSSRRRT
jgi:hypothetical protein